jgi:hypothetical protein
LLLSYPCVSTLASRAANQFRDSQSLVRRDSALERAEFFDPAAHEFAQAVICAMQITAAPYPVRPFVERQPIAYDRHTRHLALLILAAASEASAEWPMISPRHRLL